MTIDFRPWMIASCLALAQACAARTPEPEAARAPADRSAGAPAGAPVPAQPPREKLVLHLNEHVRYPVTRAALLAACAGTDEFTEGERKWVEMNLPERSFSSPDEVLSALRL